MGNKGFSSSLLRFLFSCGVTLTTVPSIARLHPQPRRPPLHHRLPGRTPTSAACRALPHPPSTTWPAAPARPGCAPRLRLPMLPRPPLFALCCGEPGLKCLVEMDARKQKSTAGSNRHAPALRSKCGPPAHITTLITSCITRPCLFPGRSTRQRRSWRCPPVGPSRWSTPSRF